MDIRILVVDDDQDSVELCEKILKKDGYRVQTLTDGRRVEEELRKNEIHLAVIDLKMPDISGLDVVEIIRHHDSDVAVILMTGYATLDSAVSALRGGVVDYLRKPVREDELLGAVRRALAAKGLALLPEEELHRNIGSAIRDLRKKRTLTLKQLAKRTGLSVSL
ncbi:MAG TPA: response regulator, partial [Myxococcales bacterium]|nr:response regulator [Myxococcales bacterium]